MPPLPSLWLSEIGLAEFAPSARSDVELYAQAWAQVRSEAATQEESFRAFIEFGAVEFALAPLYRGSLYTQQGQILASEPEPNQLFPIHISDNAVANAVYKTDCGPFMEHLWKDSSELRPWDVFAFAGDMSKLELLHISDDINTLADPGIMQIVVDGLAQRYIQAGLGSRVVESGLLDAQGLVWFAKLALLRGEDYTKMEGLQFAARFLRRGMPMA
jgi:hypothetical protein